MNDTLSRISKDYLRDLGRYLTEYQVDDATSAALISDAREGLAGLDDGEAAAQIGLLGQAEEVARNAANEQADTGQPRKGMTPAEWICVALGLLGIAIAFVPVVGLGVAIAALVWAITGRRTEPGRYRAAFGISIAAVIVNAVVSLLMLLGLLWFFPLRVETDMSDPIEIVGAGLVAEIAGA